jgi:hypothetical protein
MNAKVKFKKVLAVLVASGALALSANAQAVTLDAGIFGSTLGDRGTATNPVVLNVPVASTPSLFLDTINFDLGTNTHFNMTSSLTNLNPAFFGASIFENVNDAEVVEASPNHFSVFLPNLNLDRDYHLHPQGLAAQNASYQLTLWGSPAPVPVPAVLWLFGSGLIGLVGLARRKMNAAA